MITPKLIFKILPWFLLIVIVATLYLTNYELFPGDQKIELVESNVILEEIEQLGKLELVKYSFREIFEYKQLSDGKIIGNSILGIHDYSPDLGVILVASGEAVGCIDLTKMEISDIHVGKDSILVLLPSPELCYHKLDLENTRIYSFKNNSWWSRLFSDDNKDEEVLQMAYRETEKRIEQAAYTSGILNQTNDQAKIVLMPILESMTGKKVNILIAMPETLLDLDN